MEQKVIKKKLALLIGAIVALLVGIVYIVVHFDKKPKEEEYKIIIWEGNFVGDVTTYPDSSRYEKTTVLLNITEDAGRLVDVTVRTSSGPTKGSGGGTVITLVDNGITLQEEETQRIVFSMQPSRLEIPTIEGVEIKDIFVELQYVNFNKIHFRYANSEEELKDKDFIELKRQATNVETNHSSIVGGKKETVAECEAQTLAAGILSFDRTVDVCGKLNDESFIKELAEGLATATDDPNLYIAEEKGCYISKRQVYSFNLLENALLNTVRVYIFDKEKSPVGEIVFSKVKDKLSYEIVFFGEYSNSDVLKVLRAEPDKEYIILYNGEKNIVLDKENKPSRSGLKIIGDVFGILDKEVLKVTYNELTEDMIWVEFE